MSGKTHKPTLKVVANDKEEKKTIPLKELKINSFWNTCGEKQDGFPCSVCKEVEKVGQDWSIKSEEHNNCFWEYVADKSYPDGFMNPLSQADTAKFMGCSPTAIHMIEKAAIEKLKNSPYFEILRDYLTQEPGDSDTGDYAVNAEYSDPDESDSE